MELTLQKRFGNKVRDLRKALGWSQEEFADRSGLDRTYVSGIERGVRNPTLLIIGVLSNTLGVSLTDLFIDV